jgi:hypothetical protein
MDKVFIACTNIEIYEFVRRRMLLTTKESAYFDLRDRFNFHKIAGYRGSTLVIYGDVTRIDISELILIARARQFSIFVMDDERKLYV